MVRGAGTVWRAVCETPDCSGQPLAALSLSAPNPVFVRPATDAERQQEAPGIAAFVLADGDDATSDSLEVNFDIGAESGLHTLYVGSSPNKSSSIEVVLLNSNSIQRLELTGDGDVAVSDHVLATSGVMSVTSSGLGKLFVNSSDAIDLTRLNIDVDGDDVVQIALDNVRAEIVEVTMGGIGDVTLITNSISVSSKASVSIAGAGDLCWEADSSLEMKNIHLSLSSFGDATITSKSETAATCGTVDITADGAGDIDLGSVRCKSGSVEVYGFSEVTLQVSDSLTGQKEGFGGDIRYAGAAPKSVSTTKRGGSIASASKSYKSPVCELTAFPAFPHSSSVVSSPVSPMSVVDKVSPSSEAPVNSVPLVINTQHLDSLLPLGFAALFAALVLWVLNRSRASRSQLPRRQFGLAEDQPLVSDSQRVYI